MDSQEARAIFERELDTVEEVLDWACRDRGLRGDEADSFRSYVRMRLMEDDFAVIRSFSGRSRLRTFLSAVVSNAYIDYRVKRWGRWRPSAAAVREGRIGRLLDQRLNRDNMPLEEAVSDLLHREDVDADEGELRRVAAILPRRTRREFTDFAVTPPLASAEGAADRLLEAERAEKMTQVGAVLGRALDGLDPLDRTLVELHVTEGMTIADVARVMKVPQRPLYKRFHRALAGLRKALERDGLDRTVLSEVLPP